MVKMVKCLHFLNSNEKIEKKTFSCSGKSISKYLPSRERDRERECVWEWNPFREILMFKWLLVNALKTAVSFVLIVRYRMVFKVQNMLHYIDDEIKKKVDCNECILTMNG